MNIVNVKAIRAGERSAKVLWYVGKEKNGAIEVTMPFDATNVEALAELAVLRELILHSNLFNPVPRSGHGFRAVVTKGAIKKAMKGKSKITSMIKYSRFLNGRLQGIDLEVNPKQTMLPDAETPVTRTIELNLEPHETIETPVLGQVQITDHAYERWLERVEERSKDRPFDSLVRRLISPDLSPVAIPEKVQDQKMRKYGEDGVLDLYRHPTEPIHFGFIRNADAYVLVTVFVRTDTLLTAKKGE
ncbi:hypothetical protein [Marinobacter sp. F3R08]|uniref:hypothetical protein n=1 Tax=Marinobacter sp. F3R08 TaxID=2841559 RepID=UPI001C094CE8|nr:hypothetical protein [Marinobacter sp. F3R08]MBU2952297.1 hypothetical protein [Marinobacter sp. F3R08]